MSARDPWWPAPDHIPGVYVHVPFCRSRCDYCAFATWTDKDDLKAPYVDAVVTEAARRLRGRRPSSVFVGGGTPSQLTGLQLARIVAALVGRPGTDGSNPIEITVECNPDDATSELFAAWRGAGVNRVSFGVQSMNEQVLAALGRTHDPAAVGAAVAIARTAGFAVNVDVILGAVGESVAEMGDSLGAVLELGVDHVSAYGLTVEPGTPLAHDPRRHPDDDDIAAKYEVVDQLLEAAGLGWYEISNWARPGYECRHNVSTWMGGSYVGLGCAAHSHEHGKRVWNVRSPDRYIAAIAQGDSAQAGVDERDERSSASEHAWLMLRTRFGVAARDVDQQRAEQLVASGLLTPSDSGHALSDISSPSGRWVLTRRGRLLADEVARVLDLP